MLEDKIGHKKQRIKSHEIKVYLDAEYDPGIKTGGLINSDSVEYEV